MTNPNHKKTRLGLGIRPGDIDRCRPETGTAIDFDMPTTGKSFTVDAKLGTGRPADIDRKTPSKKGE